MKSNHFLRITMVMVALLLGWSTVTAQLTSGCGVGTGCAGCNATVKKINLDFKFGNQYFFSSQVSVCADACSIGDGTSAYIWTVTNAASYSIITQGAGFARIQITSLPGCGVTAPKPQVCLSLLTFPVGGGLPCPATLPVCVEVPCN